MTFRIDQARNGGGSALLFQGLLDEEAFDDLLAHCRPLVDRGEAVRVRLLAGTEVAPTVINKLSGIVSFVFTK